MPPEPGSQTSGLPAVDDTMVRQSSMGEDRLLNCLQVSGDIVSTFQEEDSLSVSGKAANGGIKDKEAIIPVDQATQGVEGMNLKEEERKEPRAFCWECHKAQSVCLCSRIKEKVPNRIGITILQVLNLRPLLFCRLH